MKPTVLIASAMGVAAVGLAAMRLAPHPVTLPVYREPIRFFSEEHQSLLVANTARGVNGLSAQACAGCHRKEHSEWKSSAHSRSITEPVFAAAFRAEKRTLCRSCHSPLQEQHPQLVDQIREEPSVHLNGRVNTALLRKADPQLGTENGAPLSFLAEANPQYNAALASEGVTCVTCHVRQGTVLTSHRRASSAVPHALSYSPQLSTAEFCAGCHQFQIRDPRSHPFENRLNIDPKELVKAATLHRRVAAAVFPAVQRRAQAIAPPNVDQDEPPVPTSPQMEDEYLDERRVQDTLAEFRESPAARRGETCQSCHMPKDGQRGLHTWSGRGSLAMLQKAVELQVSLDRAEYQPGDTVRGVIRLTNQAGHAFPTGDSLHAGILDVWVQSGKKTLSRQLYLMATGRNTGVVPLRGARLQVVEGGAKPATADQAGRRGPGRSIPQTAALQLLPRADTRLRTGDPLVLALAERLNPGVLTNGDLRVRVRLYHSAVHPGFHGSRIDSHQSPLTLVREQILPVHLTNGTGATAKSRAPANAGSTS